MKTGRRGIQQAYLGIHLLPKELWRIRSSERIPAHANSAKQLLLPSTRSAHSSALWETRSGREDRPCREVMITAEVNLIM
jgi:hypothetical protein